MQLSKRKDFVPLLNYFAISCIAKSECPQSCGHSDAKTKHNGGKKYGISYEVY